jgi:hypothetical protein
MMHHGHLGLRRSGHHPRPQFLSFCFLTLLFIGLWLGAGSMLRVLHVERIPIDFHE